MTGGKPYVTEVDNGVANGAVGASSARPGFGRRVVTHYKRWWWAHLIALVVVVLVVTLPVVYVGYPHIAQSDVNDSTLNITSMSISDPTPDSFQLKQTQVLGSDSMYHPTIFGFNASVSLLGAAVPFGYVQVPKIQANDGTVIHISQRLDLSDPAGFGDFAKAVMLNEEVSLNIYGRPDLKEGSLPTKTVTYNKTVTMKGLNKLDGFNVTSFHISLNTPPNVPNMNGTVYIPNPSVMMIAMGNITLDLSVNNTHIGQSFINDLTLLPGNNTVPMTSIVDQNLAISMLGKYPGGLLPIQVTGNSSVYNGQELPYFTEALASNTLTIKLNVAAGLGGSGLS